MIIGGVNGTIISAHNNGRWDFGYQCFMPENIFIDGFEVINSGNSNVELITNTLITSPTSGLPYPAVKTKAVYIKGYSAPGTGREYWFTNSYLNDIPVIKSW